jgi:predicted N-acetyltransferase YhbS
MNKYVASEKLTKLHQTRQFNCSIQELNEYLVKYAYQNQEKNISKTFVVTKNKMVVGYYTLTFGAVLKENLPVRQNLPNYPIPVIILARLAVDNKEKGNGLGKALLKNAILKTLQASEIAGIKAIMVRAKDENAKAFYKKYSFIESPIDDFTLFLPIEALK